MQSGSACLHCALAGMHWPLEQKSPAGQVTLAQALGWETGSFALQVPSAWQTPSAQSASRVHPGLTVVIEHASSVSGSHGGAGAWLLSTQATPSRATVSI